LKIDSKFFSKKKEKLKKSWAIKLFACMAQNRFYFFRCFRLIENERLMMNFPAELPFLGVGRNFNWELHCNRLTHRWSEVPEEEFRISC